VLSPASSTSSSRRWIALAAALGLALVACKKSEAPAPVGSDVPTVSDAVPAIADAPEPALADAVAAMAPADAAESLDAAGPVDAASAHAPIDAARAPVAAPADARPVVVAAPDAAPPPPPVSIDAGVAAGPPCRHAKFDTTMIGDACAQGGQAQAKAEMKKFVRGAKAKEPALECGTCHSKLAPEYPLKADGLAHFKKLGGS